MKKIFSFLLMATMLLVSGSSWANVPQAHHEPEAFQQMEFVPNVNAPARIAKVSLAALSENEAKIGETEYATFADAMAVAIANTGGQTKVEILRDITESTTASNLFKINAGVDILIELNGYHIHYDHNLGASTFLFIIHGSLTIEDHSNPSTGEISMTGTTTCGGSYSYNTNLMKVENAGKLTVNSGTLANYSTGVGCPYVVDMINSNGAEIEINGGLLYQPYNYAVRVFANNTKPNKVTINGGEIKATRPFWLQLPDKNPTSPDVNIEVNGGKLTSVRESNKESFTIYSYGQSYDKIVINFNGGEFNGIIAFGGGSLNGGLGQETVNIKGGIYRAPVTSYHRGLNRQIIEGGVFYMDNLATSAKLDQVQVNGYWYFWDSWFGNYKGYETKEFYINQGYVLEPYWVESENEYVYYFWKYGRTLSQFVEYIKPGHYAAIMCTDGAGEYTHEGIKFNPGKCSENEYWVVIDGEGPKTAQEVNADANWNNSEALADVTVTDNATLTVPSGTTAETNRLVVENGAAVIVKNGAVLNVGLGGVVVGGDQSTTSITVEPGGKFVSNGTVVSSNEEDIVVMADNEKAGNFIIAPDVNFNYQPKAKVELYTRALQKDASTFKWQRFAMPLVSATYGDNVTNDHATANAGGPVATYNNATFLTGIDVWDYENDQWTYLESTTEMKPFLGYKLANTSTNGGVTYTFSGKLVGNVADDLSFVANGYNLFGNSYTAPINILSLIESVKENAPGVAGSIWLWDVNSQSYVAENFATIEDEMSDYTEIPSLHTFILQLRDGSSASAEIDYTNAVWGHLLANVNKAPKRARPYNGNAMRIQMTSASGLADKMTLMEKDSYSAEYEDGKDADKYMNADNVNLYATLNGKDYSIVATDNLDGLNLSIQTIDETVYTLNFTKVAGADYVLYDNVANQYMTITEGAAYSFVANANTTVEGRFQIVKSHKVTTGLEEVGSELSATGVYSVLGQYIGQTADFNSLPAGVYVINGQKVIK